MLLQRIPTKFYTAGENFRRENVRFASCSKRKFSPVKRRKFSPAKYYFRWTEPGRFLGRCLLKPLTEGPGRDLRVQRFFAAVLGSLLNKSAFLC